MQEHGMQPTPIYKKMSSRAASTPGRLDGAS